MPTPRSESIIKSRAHHDTIPPLEDDADAHKIDRFAVIAQVLEPGVQNFINTPMLYTFLSHVDTKRELNMGIKATLQENVMEAVMADEFFAQHLSLAVAQAERFRAGQGWSPEVKDIIFSGVSTFVETFSTVFDILERAYGPDVAANPNHWRIPDKIAKIHARHLSAYFSTFLGNSRNWTKTINHFEKDLENGGVKFKEGYPLEAEVPALFAEDTDRIFTDDDILLATTTEFVKVSDIQTNTVTVGCPITFSNDALKQLWSIYGETRSRLSPYYHDDRYN